MGAAHLTGSVERGRRGENEHQAPCERGGGSFAVELHGDQREDESPKVKERERIHPLEREARSGNQEEQGERRRHRPENPIRNFHFGIRSFDVSPGRFDPLH